MFHRLNLSILAIVNLYVYSVMTSYLRYFNLVAAFVLLSFLSYDLLTSFPSPADKDNDDSDNSDSPGPHL